MLYTFPRLLAGGASGLAEDASGAIYGFDFTEVFKLTPSSSGYAFSVLYTLTGHTGKFIAGPPLIDSNGTIYGTAVQSGDLKCATRGCGTVFDVVPTKDGYAANILHEFTGPPSDGMYPIGGVVMNKGSLYGVTIEGGAHKRGIVYKLARTKGGYTERVLHDFHSTIRDGVYPEAGLVTDPSGKLYGTTIDGGGNGCYYGDGCGMVFEITP